MFVILDFHNEDNINSFINIILRRYTKRATFWIKDLGLNLKSG